MCIGTMDDVLGNHTIAYIVTIPHSSTDTWESSIMASTEAHAQRQMWRQRLNFEGGN